MKFSGYFVLASAVVLVLFAQQSNAGIVDVFKAGIDAIKDELNIGNKRERDAIRAIKQYSKENEDAKIYVNITIFLKNQYIKGVKILSKSKDIIDNRIDEYEKLIPKNSEAAKQSLHQGFKDAQSTLFDSGLPVIKAIALALGFSNDGAREGLGAASEYVQKAGFSTLDALILAESFFNQGNAAGANATQALFKTLRLVVESGYAGSYTNVVKSFPVALKSLRDAASRPMQGQIENRNCETAENDREASYAINNIDEDANNAMKRGANPKLVENFTKSLKCSVGNIAKITAEGREIVEEIKKIAKAESSVAMVYYKKGTDNIKEQIHKEAATMFLNLGILTSLSGNQSNNAADAAIMSLEQGKVEYFLGIKTGQNSIFNGLSYSGDAPLLGYQGATEALDYAEIALFETIVEFNELALSML